MFIFMFNHVAPWSCETWHFVPLYVHTFSRMTIKLNLSWLKVISLYLYCLCGRLGTIKMFTKSYPTCLSTYLLAYICADMIRHQHTATLALSWLPAKMSECRLRDVNHRSSIQTKDNIVQTLSTSVSTARGTIHLHTMQAKEHSMCFLRFRPVLISDLGWDHWSMLDPPHRGPLCMESIVLQH